jgi:transcriptional regulator with XRE-family HTH domain
VGRRVRELRRKLGLTQADLAGDDYSAAYVSTIETGRRTASPAMLDHLAARLGVEVADLSNEHGATWALQLARDLRSGGRARAARDLLERVLSNLEGAGRVPPSALMVMHREIALDESERDLTAAERHLERAVEYAGRGRVAVTELALTYVVLGDVRARRGRHRGAARAYRRGAAALLELHGRDVEAPPPTESA